MTKYFSAETDGISPRKDCFRLAFCNWLVEAGDRGMAETVFERFKTPQFDFHLNGVPAMITPHLVREITGGEYSAKLLVSPKANIETFTRESLGKEVYESLHPRGEEVLRIANEEIRRGNIVNDTRGIDPLSIAPSIFAVSNLGNGEGHYVTYVGKSMCLDNGELTPFLLQILYSVSGVVDVSRSK